MHFYSGVEHGDEIYSLCQLSPVVCKPAIQDKPSSPQKQKQQPQQQKQQPVTSAKKPSSTEKVFKPKCLVDSSTFLLPAGNGPVYLDVNGDGKPRAVLQSVTSTASVIKKKPESCSESPKATTSKIFAPRTEDMNKGFLTFSDDDTGLTSEYHSRFPFIYYAKKYLNNGHCRSLKFFHHLKVSAIQKCSLEKVSFYKYAFATTICPTESIICGTRNVLNQFLLLFSIIIIIYQFMLFCGFQCSKMNRKTWLIWPRRPVMCACRWTLVVSGIWACSCPTCLMTSYSPTVHWHRLTRCLQLRLCTMRTLLPPGLRRQCTTYITITSTTAATNCRSTLSPTCAIRPCPRCWAWTWTIVPMTWTWTYRSRISSYPYTKTTYIHCCRTTFCGAVVTGRLRPNRRRLRPITTTAAAETTTGERRGIIK